MPKNVLHPFHFINAQSMAATFTSSPIGIMTLDNIAITLKNAATGTPVGTYTVEVSNDYIIAGAVNSDAIWEPLSGVSGAVNGAFQTMFDLNQLSQQYIRVVYTRSSGTGTAEGWITGKAV